MKERILYCHCAFARVLPPAAKAAVLAHLAHSGTSFEAVPDLCEMSARRDDRLRELAASEELTIVACYPRAVHGLFQSAGTPLQSDAVRVLNMRTDSPESITAAIDELIT